MPTRVAISVRFEGRLGDALRVRCRRLCQYARWRRLGKPLPLVESNYAAPALSLLDPG